MEADKILYSDSIFDSVKNEPFSGGIAIKDKKIIGVGRRQDMTAFAGEATQVIEFGDKTIMPGFCDNHGHYSAGADYFFEKACHNMERCKSLKECLTMIRDFADDNPELPRYRGQGWYLSYWEDSSTFPTKEDLDSVIPDKPVYLLAADYHSLWMNSKAVEESMLRERMPEYSSEIVLRDSKGEPTGIVREASFQFMPGEEQTIEEKKSNQKNLIYELNKWGITAFSDVQFIEPERLAFEYRLMKELDNEGNLNLRFYVYPGTNFDAEKISEVAPYKAFFNSESIRISGLKTIIDGVTATYTAVLLEPYEDDPTTKGVLVAAEDKIKQWVCKANGEGYGVRIHCIGDGAVRLALDIFEYSNSVNDNTDIRNAIEHIEIISPEDIPRFKELNVIASMQPRHQILDNGSKVIRCGAERSRYEWAFRSILHAGGRIALGTDYPIVSFNPYENMYMGLTKNDLEGKEYCLNARTEILTLPESIKGYTIEGAYCNGTEKELGTLEVGKLADITVANKNLFNIKVSEIKDCFSVMTLFNGNIVFDIHSEKEIT